MGKTLAAVGGNPTIPLRREHLMARFERGCREAIEAADHGPKTDAEHNALAEKLGRPDLVRDLQDDLPLGPPAA